MKTWRRGVVTVGSWCLAAVQHSDLHRIQAHLALVNQVLQRAGRRAARRAPERISTAMMAVRDRPLEAVTSWELAEEIVEVLRRPKLARHGLTETDVRNVLELLSPLLPRIEVDPPLRDPGDVPVVAAAVAGAA